MHNINKIIFLLILLAKIQVWSAIPVIEIYQDSFSKKINNLVEFYEDESANLTIHDLLDSINHQEFLKNPNSSLNFGYKRSAIWIRFIVQHNKYNEIPFVLQQRFADMDYVDFFIIKEGKIKKEIKTGLMRPATARDKNDNFFSFDVTGEQGEDALIYLRFQNTSSMTIDLFLRDRNSYLTNKILDYSFNGAFVAVLLIFLIYNLYISIYLKERSNFYFFLSILGFLLFYLTYFGYSHLYQWWGNLTWNKYSIVIYNNFISIGFLLFTQRFLRIKDYSEPVYIFILSLVFLAAVNSLMLPMVGFYYASQGSLYITFLSFTIMFISGIIAYKKRFKPALNFLISFIGVIVMAVYVVLIRFGISDPNNYLEYYFMGAISFFIFTVTEAQFSRISILKTEKEKSELQFKKSEERFRALVETTNDFIWETDSNGCYTYVSPNVKEILGYEPDELLSKKPFDLMPSSESNKIQKKFKQYVDLKKPIINLKNINVRKDGTIIVLETSGIPFFDNKNQLLGYRGVDRDITERKKYEDELLKSENNFKALLDATSAMAFLVDKDFTVIALNNVLAEKYGSDRNKIVGKNIVDFLPPALAANRIKIMKTVIKTGKAIRWVDKGSKGIYDNNIYPVFNKNGRVINLAIYSNDISEKIRAEEQIKVLSTSVEQSPFSIIIFSKDGTIEYVNKKCCQVTEYLNTELINKNIVDLRPEMPLKQIIEKVLAGEEIKGEYKVHKKSGVEYWESIYLFPIKNDYNEILNIISINEDITDRKELESHLRQAQKMEAIGTLAGGIAHDFNNLLTIINGYSDLALSKLEDGLIKNSITNIRMASQRAEDLTRQILAFSKKQIFSPKSINVNTILNNLNKMIPRLIGEHIKIEMNLGKKLKPIKADPSQYEQVILNLIVNARDAINENTDNKAKKSIRINTEEVILEEKYLKHHFDIKPGKYICLSITDTGIGMSAEVQAKMFEPFFTTKEQGKGTGMGLSTVFGIVKQNDGNIYVYSEPGKGTTIKIYWPVTSDKIAAKKTKILKTQLLTGTENILFVEDNPDILDFAYLTLTEYGYNVIFSENGRLALEMLKENPAKFDLLITDIVMPDMNGKELAEKVSRLIPGIKILFTSGYTDDHIVHEGELTGEINFLQKPFTVNSLLIKIKEVLKK
jgi:PAS domain S-box-containing protein